MSVVEILHAEALTSQGAIPDSYIYIENRLIQSVEPWAGQPVKSTGQVIAARGLLASPGWIDIQLNGGFGKDFTQNPEAIWEVAAQLPRFGTTAFLPTIITAPREAYEQAIEVLHQGPPQGWKGAEPLGLHFEGPFLNPLKKGAHNPLYLRAPEPEFIQQWSRENNVLLVTLAPELPGALELAKTLIERGVVVSAGHSMTTFDGAEAAFMAGIRCGSHLYNAMPPIDHRSPGLTSALLTNENIYTSLIADGIHAHPAMVHLAWKCKGAARLVLASDAMAALGMPPGEYKLGDQVTIVDQTSARLSDGTLAGSIVTQEQELMNLMKYCSLETGDVFPSLSQTPANLLGLPAKGRLEPGADADITLVSADGLVQFTIAGGEILYSKREAF